MPRKCSLWKQRILDNLFACYKKLDPTRYVLHYLQDGCGSPGCLENQHVHGASQQMTGYHMFVQAGPTWRVLKRQNGVILCSVQRKSVRGFQKLLPLSVMVARKEPFRATIPVGRSKQLLGMLGESLIAQTAEEGHELDSGWRLYFLGWTECLSNEVEKVTEVWSWPGWIFKKSRSVLSRNGWPEKSRIEGNEIKGDLNTTLACDANLRSWPYSALPELSERYVCHSTVQDAAYAAWKEYSSLHALHHRVRTSSISIIII